LIIGSIGFRLWAFFNTGPVEGEVLPAWPPGGILLSIILNRAFSIYPVPSHIIISVILLKFQNILAKLKSPKP
jgi:hypothetical protein